MHFLSHLFMYAIYGNGHYENAIVFCEKILANLTVKSLL